MMGDLITLAEQMKEWAKILREGTSPTISIAAGLEEVAADMLLDGLLGSPDWEEELRQVATDMYGSENVVVDGTATFSLIEDEGVWVSARLWVDKEEVPLPTPLEALAGVHVAEVNDG